VQGYALSMPPRALARWLPQLGGVLYLAAQPRGALAGGQTGGLLVEQAWLTPLHRSHRVYAVSTVTPDGPREWADVADAHGRPCARIYLLPGTDYCAWDAMLCGAGGSPGAAAPGPAFAASAARLVRFRHRALAGLDVLGVEDCEMCPLDRRVAGEIVRHEAAALASG
jgi:hypothetical protein